MMKICTVKFNTNNRLLLHTHTVSKTKCTLKSLIHPMNSNIVKMYIILCYTRLYILIVNSIQSLLFQSSYTSEQFLFSSTA